MEKEIDVNEDLGNIEDKPTYRRIKEVTIEKAEAKDLMKLYDNYMFLTYHPSTEEQYHLAHKVYVDAVDVIRQKYGYADKIVRAIDFSNGIMLIEE